MLSAVWGNVSNIGVGFKYAFLNNEGVGQPTHFTFITFEPFVVTLSKELLNNKFQ